MEAHSAICTERRYELDRRRGQRPAVGGHRARAVCTSNDHPERQASVVVVSAEKWQPRRCAGARLRSSLWTHRCVAPVSTTSVSTTNRVICVCEALRDTNVLSEVTKPAPTQGLWNGWTSSMRTVRSSAWCSIAEIRRGVALMDEGPKREALAEWLAQDLPRRFEQRVLHIDEPIALAWGDLMALAKRRGRGLSSVDGLIAATAIARTISEWRRATRRISRGLPSSCSILGPPESRSKPRPSGRAA